MGIEETLRSEAVHRGWSDSYRGSDNEAFDALMFDWVLAKLKLPHSSLVLDAGCGDARHSIRLATKGFRVHAWDFSDFAFDNARNNVGAAGLGNNIIVRQVDLTNNNESPGVYDAVFCMGVLMHIPDLASALKTIVDIVRPGGYIVLSESSIVGIDMLLRRALYYLKPSASVELTRTSDGIECWSKTTAGILLTRSNDIKVLIETLHHYSCKLLARRPGEFSEFYRRFPSGPVRRSIHFWNRLWFRMGIPAPATGQLLIFQKHAP